MRPSVGYWKDAWRRLKANKVAMGSLVVILLVVLAAIIGPMLSPYEYDQINKGSENLPPNAHSLGRDLFTRTMIGGSHHDINNRYSVRCNLGIFRRLG